MALTSVFEYPIGPLTMQADSPLERCARFDIGRVSHAGAFMISAPRSLDHADVLENSAIPSGENLGGSRER